MRLGTAQSWMKAAALVISVGLVLPAHAQAPADKPAFTMRRLSEPAPPVPDAKGGADKNWTMHSVGPVQVNCAAMEKELADTSVAFNATCGGQSYAHNLQRCSSLSDQLLTGSQNLQRYAAVCKSWSAAALQQNISAARENMRLIESARAASRRRPVERDDRDDGPTPAEQFNEGMRKAACAQDHGGYYTMGYMNCVQ